MTRRQSGVFIVNFEQILHCSGVSSARDVLKNSQNFFKKSYMVESNFSNL